jgi:predicted RNase H-like nuclease (RuvC/YqgF family)
MAIENKEELVKKIAVLEEKLLTLKKASEELVVVKNQLENVLKSKEEITANEHTVRKDLEKSQAEVVGLKKAAEGKDKQIEVLKADLTKLANLFDEYIVAYQDQVKMLGVFLKNTQTVEKYLSGKINDFNGGSKK